MSKYRVSTPDRRTDCYGVLYASRAEMLYATQLKLDPDVAWFLRQVPVQLGADTLTRVDFLVGYSAIGDPNAYRIEAHEVKGCETREFKRIKRLWSKYAPFPMRVIRNGKTVEMVEPLAVPAAESE